MSVPPHPKGALKICAEHTEKKTISFRILVGQSNEKCLFKDRIIWEYNIKMDLKKVGCQKVNGTEHCQSHA
jgi:hypothetical protein